jgi:hypothetical protein
LHFGTTTEHLAPPQQIGDESKTNIFTLPLIYGASFELNGGVAQLGQMEIGVNLALLMLILNLSINICSSRAFA